MNPYLIKSAEMGPAILEQLVKRIPATSWDSRPDPERFTLRESIAHLADFEPIFRERMARACAQPGCKVEVFDESELAIQHDYGSQDMLASIEQFKAERHVTANLLKSFSDTDWDKVFHHPQIGVMRISDMANMLPEHDLYHIDHAMQFLP